MLSVDVGEVGAGGGVAVEVCKNPSPLRGVEALHLKPRMYR